MLQKWKRNEEFVTEREVIYGISDGKGKEKRAEDEHFKLHEIVVPSFSRRGNSAAVISGGCLCSQRYRCG